MLTSLILDGCQSSASLLAEVETREVLAEYLGQTSLALKNATLLVNTERTVAAIGLRRFGVRPSGQPCFNFREADSGIRLAFPSRLANRDQLVMTLAETAATPTSLDVSNQLGSPDLIGRYSAEAPTGRGRAARAEKWGYLLGLGEKLRVLILIWKEGSDGEVLSQKQIAPVDAAELVVQVSCFPGYWV